MGSMCKSLKTMSICAGSERSSRWRLDYISVRLCALSCLLWWWRGWPISAYRNLHGIWCLQMTLWSVVTSRNTLKISLERWNTVRGNISCWSTKPQKRNNNHNHDYCQGAIMLGYVLWFLKSQASKIVGTWRVERDCAYVCRRLLKLELTGKRMYGCGERGHRAICCRRWCREER